MATHSSTLAWKKPWVEEPSRLQSMGLLRVRHDWATSLSLSLSCIGEGNGNPLQCSCLENPRDGGASWAAIYGVAQSRTRLKQLSSSSSKTSPTPFEHNGLLFWVPDVLCRHSEVVLWNLFCVQMFFWWICWGESGLPVLFLCHLLFDWKFNV